jgi:hypothetical protein
MHGFLTRLSAQLAGLNPFAFVYLILFLSYVVVLPIVVLDTVVVNDALHMGGGPSNLPAFGMAGRLIVGSLITPLIETAIFQWAPIRVLRTWLKLPTLLAVCASAVFFAAAHTYSIGYVVFTFFVGLVLVYGFVLKDYRGGKAYLLICIVHALRNAIASLLM